jgi:hypothetical protein
MKVGFVGKVSAFVRFVLFVENFFLATRAVAAA